MSASIVPPLSDLAAVSAVFLTASLLQGTTGFGFGMLPMALLPFFMSVKYASVLVAMLAIFNAAYLAWSLRKSIPWGVLFRLLIGSVIGLPLGVYLLKAAPESFIKRIVGVMVIVYSVYHAVNQRKREKTAKLLPLWWSYPTGAVAGSLAGAANVAGPPLIFYLYSQPLGRDVLRSALASYFLVASSAKSGLSIAFGLAEWNMIAYAVVLPFIWIGAKIGLELGTRLNRDMFANVVLVTLAVLGIILVVKG